MGTQLPLPERGIAPQFSAHITCGQIAAWIKMSHGMELGLVPGDFVLDGDPLPPPPKGAKPPIFGPCLLWPNGWMVAAGTFLLGIVVGLSPGAFVLDGDPAPPTKGGGAPSQFSAHFYCVQTAGCIKMPFGMDVGLSPGTLC